MLREISPVIYHLELPPHWTLHNIFHALLLTPYQEMPEHGINFHEPPLELIKGEEEYEVEWVLNSQHHRKAKKLQFLIQWKGYSAAHDSWEGVDGVHAPELIEEYFQRKQSAVQATVLKGKQEFSISIPPSSSPLPTPIHINTTSFLSMDHAAPFQSSWTTTTPISEPGQPEWCPDQHLRAGTWSDDSVWVYSNPSDATAMEKRVDDNWGKLYQAILNFNQPLSIVANALQFREEVPSLVKGGSGALTPPLSNHFDWSISLPTFDHETPNAHLGLAPVNTMAPSPRAEDDDATAKCGEPLQPAWDIYSGPPAPGSDADRQQWLCAELRDSLHLREFSPEIGQWGSTSGSGSLRMMKRPALDEIAMRTNPKKAKTHPKMRLTHYYCSKCHVDNANHSYEQCPTWKFCGFCDKVGHWGFYCSTPHVKCMRLRCGVHVGVTICFLFY